MSIATDDRKLPPDPDKSTTATPQTTASTASCREAADRDHAVYVAEECAKHYQASRAAAWEAFKSARGSRYAGCRLANFEARTDEMMAAWATVQAFADNIVAEYSDGTPLLLFGPTGTGKDHLMVGVVHELFASVRVACRSVGGYDAYRAPDVHWCNGPDLFGAIRQGIAESTEKKLIEDYARYELLVISDPVPPAGRATDYQITTLYRILDRRYSNTRPTWCTLNVAKRAELEDRVGAAVAGRLTHGAEAVFCNWESYRRERR